MARTTNKNRKLDIVIEKEIYQDLLKEIKNIDSHSDLDNFFNKFMTKDEKTLLLRRTAIIKLINRGKKYTEIKELLSVSDNTISNVRDILDGRGYGRNPNRKRVYSKTKDYRKKKRQTFFPDYKGAKSII
jgi:uncharacterized protein YerC